MPSRALHVCLLVVGDRVRHPKRGDGAVTNVSALAAKPLTVRYDNGEVHNYSDASSAKLDIIATMPRSWLSRLRHPDTPARRRKLKPLSSKPQHPHGSSKTLHGSSKGLHGSGKFSYGSSDDAAAKEQYAHAVLSALVVRLDDPQVEAALERLARQLHMLDRDAKGMLSHDALLKLVASLDHDGDGTLARSELIYGLNKHGIRMSDEELINAMYAFDADNDGSVDANEFVIAMIEYTEVLKLKKLADAMKGIGTLKTAPVPDLCVGTLGALVAQHGMRRT
jgi:Ca2+-binding EF-hand superfamily protein